LPSAGDYTQMILYSVFTLFCCSESWFVLKRVNGGNQQTWTFISHYSSVI
jgi:hypothetical protein